MIRFSMESRDFPPEDDELIFSMPLNGRGCGSVSGKHNDQSKTGALEYIYVKRSLRPD